VQALQDNLEGKCGAYEGGCESMAALAAFERGLRRQGVAHGDAATSRQLAGNSYIGYDRLGRNVWCCARTATRPAGCCGPKT
jgi:hypothetical protein